MDHKGHRSSLDGDPTIRIARSLSPFDHSQMMKFVGGHLRAEHRIVVLKDFMVECAPADFTHLDLAALSVNLSVLIEGEWDTRRMEEVSPTMWKCHRIIQLVRDMDELVFVIQSETTGDLGFATFPKEELLVFMAEESEIKLERDLVMTENIPALTLTLTIGISYNMEEIFLDTIQNPAFASKAFDLFSHDAGDMHTFGIALCKRFRRTNNKDDIDKAILYLERAVQLTNPHDNANYGARIHDAGLAFLAKFNSFKNLADIDKAILLMESAVACTSEGSVGLSGRFINLGGAFRIRFQCIGAIADVESAIENFQKVVDLTPDGHSDKPWHLHCLGTLFSDRFEFTEELTDIDIAISSLQRAVQLTAEDCERLPAHLQNLGGSFLKRFELTEDLTDLDNSISSLQRSVQLTPEAHADLPSRLSNLGSSFLYLFNRTGKKQDIDSAVVNLQKAVQLSPGTHPDMHSLLTNLGNSFLRRFDCRGDLIDIEGAISSQQRAVQLTPEDLACTPSYLQNLGISFSKRFERTGELTDLENSILSLHKAIQLTPEAHASMPRLLSNLGISLSKRFQQTKELRNIESAILNLQRAIQLTPETHPTMRGLLTNLGKSFSTRFRCTGQIIDIESAISTLQRVVQLTPEDHADMPGYLQNLGTSFFCRFQHTAELTDIESSISTLQRSVHLTPEADARLCFSLNTLGLLFSLRFAITTNYEDLVQATSMFRLSATQIIGDPSIRLHAALGWAKGSRVFDHSNSLIAFSIAIELLPQVASLDQTIHKRHQALGETYNATACAAAVAIEAMQLEMALSWLEQGRCLIWNQINQLRLPADDLRAHDPSLADRFLHLARALEASGSRQEEYTTFSEENISRMISLQEEAYTHVRLAKDWTNLLSEIRGISGFQEFLRPPQASSILSCLPLDGPIVIFNIEEDRCDALALISGLNSPLHIPLETFSLKKAIQLRDDIRGYLTDQNVRQREVDRSTFRFRAETLGGNIMCKVLHDLWVHVAKPILNALGYSPSSSTRSRIWWCPTGPLTFLPIHASGIYGNNETPAGQCVSDFVISSYTPTVSVLLGKMKEALRVGMDLESISLLLISQPSTPGQTVIPGAREETQALQDMTEAAAIKSLLLEDASATIMRVKEEMQTHTWVHFACHAIQDTYEPLQSGVQLHDGRLELLEMMKQKIPNADFAFLSACQTSTGNEKLPDEVVHIAAGMFAAGYRSVVATMWSIQDKYGPVVASDFYAHILPKNPGDRHLNSANAAHAIHYATQKIRKELGDTEEALLTWVPYMHIGI